MLAEPLQMGLHNPEHVKTLVTTQDVIMRTLCLPQLLMIDQ